MTEMLPDKIMVQRIRWAGVLYLLIITAGLGAELGLRGPLIIPGDAHSTASNILSNTIQFRLAIAADLIMAIADTGLAILLFLVFRSAMPGVALAAMVFRLIQGIIIAFNLITLQLALNVINDGLRPELALMLIESHSLGYDLGLFFFGFNSLLMAVLIWQTRLFGRVFSIGLCAAGVIYLTGSTLHFFFPNLLDQFMPAYGVTILVETAFCLRLLFQRAKRFGTA